MATKTVVKCNGEIVPFDIDVLRGHLKMLRDRAPVLPNVDIDAIALKIAEGLPQRVPVHELVIYAAETAAYQTTVHPDHGSLAARISAWDLHKNTPGMFLEAIEILRDQRTPKTNEPTPLIADDVYEIIKKHNNVLEAAINYSLDFTYDYFGLKTLFKTYLMKAHGKTVERPQHMLMRVAVGIHKDDIKSVLRTYKYLSEGWFIHATPTLFNAGTPNPHLSSCFLTQIQEDSIAGIYKTLSDCALISKSAGGIGISAHHIRASKSYIKGTNGMSNGLVPMLRVFNDTARYVDQGGGKRKGAFTVYLEPWHADVFDFLDLKKNHGKEEMRARDLFYGMWIPDLFMQRVKDNQEWSLFCPNEAPGLNMCWGEEFEALYEKYEREGRARQTVKAQELWFHMLHSQIETGTPYMLYKDACNRKSNQQHLGTIQSSNLCTEIIEYTSPDEIAVCNLASIALPKFVNEGAFDHRKLFEVAYHVTGNLNKIIDVNHYPVPEAERSNKRHRPIGIGIQGLADTFIKLRLPFDSSGAKKLNREIMETIYYASLTASSDLARSYGPHESFPGSPASKGILQYDMWVATPSDRWDWTALKQYIANHGLRNSLLLAPMPTASTSQILGNNECFEPYTSNVYTRRVLCGEFTVVNKHLVDDLTRLGLWNEDVRRQIIADGGSVQNIYAIPKDIRLLYRTAWELSQRDLIDMAADRGAFIDQSQSFNVFLGTATNAKLSSMHFYAWNKGLKTGMYYLRTKAAASAIQFTVDQQKLKDSRELTRSNEEQQKKPLSEAAAAAVVVVPDGELCRLEEGCLICSS